MNLIEAVKEGNLNKATALLANNVDVDQRNDKGQTALFFAIQNGDDEMVDLLLDAGADVNVKDNLDQTPIHYAAVDADYSIMFKLIENDANINAQDINGCTPVFYVLGNTGNGILSKERKDVLLLLAENGVDYTIGDDSGMTPLEQFDNLDKNLSLFTETEDISYSKEDVSIFKKDLSFFKEVFIDAVAWASNLNSSQQKNPLGKKLNYYKLPRNISISTTNTIIGAAKEGNLDKVKELLANNVDIDQRNDKGQTALFFAIQYGDSEMVDLLLEAGADVNAKNNLNQTPMHYAALDADYDMVDKLIENDARINEQDNDGRTPVFYVLGNTGNGILSNERKDVLLLLARNGVDYTIKDYLGDTPLDHFSKLKGDVSYFLEDFLREADSASNLDLSQQENDKGQNLKSFGIPKNIGFSNTDKRKRQVGGTTDKKVPKNNKKGGLRK